MEEWGEQEILLLSSASAQEVICRTEEGWFLAVSHIPEHKRVGGFVEHSLFSRITGLRGSSTWL